MSELKKTLMVLSRSCDVSFDLSGTAAADISTLLRDFCHNSQTAKVTTTREVSQERYFHRASFELLAMNL